MVWIGPMAPLPTNATPGELPLGFWVMVGVMVAALIFAGGVAYGLHIAGRGRRGDDGRGFGDDDPPEWGPVPDPGGLQAPDTIPSWVLDAVRVVPSKNLQRVTLAEPEYAISNVIAP